jgi:RNA polymerase sigma-70 factor (ECF subfamily)
MADAAPHERFQTLLREARQGSREALGELFGLYRVYLQAVAAGELTDELRAKGSGSDLVQDAFLEAQQLLDRFTGSGPDEFRAWLRAVLLNKLRELRQRYHRVQSRQVGRETPLEAHDHLIPDDASSPSAVAARQEQEALLVAAVARLPETYQAVIRWRSWDRLSFAEIGRRLGRSEDAVRMLWGRAINRLEKELQGRQV